MSTSMIALVVLGALMVRSRYGNGVTTLVVGETGEPPMQREGYRNGQRVSIYTMAVDDFGHELACDAAASFVAMRACAESDGVPLRVVTAFRTNEEQAELYRRYKAGTGNLAAPPGYSNHQLGLSVDIDTSGQYRQSLQYAWLDKYAHVFGFKNDVSSEAWHWTYLP